MNTEHTPGPWKPAEQLSTHIIDSRGIMVADAPHFREMTREEGFANRDLIAAAPDLLAALKALTSNPHVNLGDLVYKVRDSEGEGWDGPHVKHWSDAVQAARAAIAKAEGKA